MDEKGFWILIEETISDDKDLQAERLRSRLETIPKADLIDFNLHYRNALADANSWDLWAAAYIINGGCSDDGFDYFRDWLISRGQRAYDAAMSDPEALIESAAPWVSDFEEFRYIMVDVIERVHGSRFATVPSQEYKPPFGEEWDEETVETRYPKLAEWVNAAPPNTPVAAPENIHKLKPGFFKRLFGKT